MMPLPRPDEPPADVAAALAALMDGRLSDEELVALEQRLLADPAALAEYCELIDLEFALAWELKSRIAAVEPADTSPPAPRRRLPGGLAIPLGLAGVAAAAVMLLLMPPMRGPLTGSQSVILTAADSARWAMPATPEAGEPVPTGPLRLAAGDAQLTFPSGAVVAMHGPAEVDVLGDNRMFLRRGRITPFVPESAKGFTVVSPTGEVVDFGTEFSVSVADDGQTDVFVIGGEVDVSGGHMAERSPLRLTQGFATSVSANDPRPQFTQKPIVIDHFGDADGPLMWQDIHPEYPTAVTNGGLRIPIEGEQGRQDPTVQIMLNHDFSVLVGRRSTISYKAMLPAKPGVSRDRWVALAIDSGQGPLPWAHRPGTAAAVLVSPEWQVGTIVQGNQIRQREVWPRQTIFPRGSEAVGPYQVVITIDDTPAGRDATGHAALTVMINGVEFVKRFPIELGDHPRLAFQTFMSRHEPGVSHAVIDDFSVSVDVPPADVAL
jgi:ferric-dicitrate binding protein FerR (iron transport regulator)